MLKITVPLPPNAIRPNSRSRVSFVEREAKRQMREAGFVGVREQISSNPFHGNRLHITYKWFPQSPRGKFLDDDNVIAAMKSTRDGIAQALGIDDARWVTHPVERGKKQGGGYVEITIHEDYQKNHIVYCARCGVAVSNEHERTD